MSAAGGRTAPQTSLVDSQRAKSRFSGQLSASGNKVSGHFRGQRISADERVTDVYRKVDGRWLCVLTHLTTVAALSEPYGMVTSVTRNGAIVTFTG